MRLLVEEWYHEICILVESLLAKYSLAWKDVTIEAETSVKK